MKTTINHHQSRQGWKLNIRNRQTQFLSIFLSNLYYCLFNQDVILYSGIPFISIFKKQGKLRLFIFAAQYSCNAYKVLQYYCWWCSFIYITYSIAMLTVKYLGLFTIGKRSFFNDGWTDKALDTICVQCFCLFKVKSMQHHIHNLALTHLQAFMPQREILYHKAFQPDFIVILKLKSRNHLCKTVDEIS